MLHCTRAAGRDRAWTPYDYKLSNQMRDVVMAFAGTCNRVAADAEIPRYDPSQVDLIENHPPRRN